MKHLSSVIIAVILAVLMATLLPAQVFADTPDYISEVKLATGSTTELEAEGYTILANGKKAVDLNQGAGGGWGSKGDKAVYLGYKTTKERSEAITDLALMNMKGGYSVKDYEILMETQMKSQIIPLVDGFLATIQEYRENYEAGVQRAVYLKGILNKFTDDDTGKGLGDLLLNETKYEMGDEAYNALSEDEKKEHADLLTIFAQANGKAILTIQDVLTRAADTNEDSWLDRFSATTYDELVEATGLSSRRDAEKQLAKTYDDSAMQILDMWEGLYNELSKYDEYTAYAEEYDEKKMQETEAKADALANIDENSSDEEVVEAVYDFRDVLIAQDELLQALRIIMLHDTLAEMEYGDGSLLDFFMQSAEEIEEDITVLYPLAAAMSDGQRAGLEFISLEEMLMIAFSDDDAYADTRLDEIEPLSIYDGVDRAIYEKGAVALTSDALRGDFADQVEGENGLLSGWSIAMWVVTGAMAISAITTAGLMVYFKNAGKHIEYLVSKVTAENAADLNLYGRTVEYIDPDWGKAHKVIWKHDELYARSAYCKWMSVGFTAAMVVMAGISVYLTYRDMVNHYKVEFTPIPHYIVDEKDITGYNAKGEKIVLKNQSAYYKVVECDRNSGDYFDVVGTCGDLNGYVGKQWLALYAVKNDAMLPILADSLLVKVDSEEVPAGYTTGIHMFGSDAAFNLNSNLYVWNDSAKSVFVYYKTDENAANVTASTFTGGTLVLAGGAGLLLGVAATALVAKVTKKRNDNKTVTV